MNAASFKEWFIYSFLNLLEEGSSIIMDNASYHSVVTNKPPITNFHVFQIQDWLNKNNIPFEPHETKTELLAKIRQYNTQPKSYELDQIAIERGH